MLDQQYWNQRYAEAQTGWDIGSPSTPLKTWIDGYSNTSASMLIPGCGNAHEAAYLLEKGFTNITLIDIAPLVVQTLTQHFSRAIADGHLKVICGDFFALQGQYDIILEQTFFCALHPSLRKAYTAQMHQLLVPGGKLIGLLFNFPLTEDGPPFGGSEAEYREYVGSLFLLAKLDPCYNSIAPRAGRELWIEWIKV